jgi:Putative MetA-pathway of phenol degradation
MRRAAFLLVVVVSCCSTTLFAQNGVISDWLDMVTQTQSEQPHWITPLNTTTPRLEQEFRYDVQWQTHNDGTTTTNVGVSKGLEIIPQKNTEIILAVPPYIINNPDSSPRDGFGDWQFLVKYRLAAGNEEHGNYILTLFYQMTLPTGQYQEGNPSPVITPTIAYGKGFGHFDVQGTLGGSLPTGNINKIGHALLWNNTLQYKVFKKLWPETEFNMTRYYGGSHDGHTVLYVTPGLVLGRFPIHNRIAFTFGGGIQIAATSFHPTNHIPILSLRVPF